MRNAGVELRTDMPDASGASAVVAGSSPGALGGIGFTVSLFIAGLAFDDPPLAGAAKLATLGSSVVAAGVGAAILARTR